MSAGRTVAVSAIVCTLEARYNYPTHLSCRRLASTRAMSDKIEIDITSDTVCPWCYVGKRRLEKAIKELQVELDLSSPSKEYQLVSVNLMTPGFRNLLPTLHSSSMLSGTHLYLLHLQGEGKEFEVRWHPFQLNPGVLVSH